MSSSLERAKHLHGSIRSALLIDWDPIGINDVPEASDEKFQSKLSGTALASYGTCGSTGEV